MALFDDKTPAGLLHQTAAAHSARSLAEILYGGRPEANKLYYRNQTIKLDGYTFRGCRFDGCHLEVTSSNFDIIDCIIDEKTVITYGDSVVKVIQLFNSRFDWAYKNFPFFAPRKNPDGTITITDKAT
jgi:hypothetical protein